VAVIGSIWALNWLEGSLTLDCEKVKKEVVNWGRWGLPGRMANTTVAFSRLRGRAVTVSKVFDGWILVGAVTVFDDDEVFRP
jgi:hypothetical protein